MSVRQALTAARVRLCKLIREHEPHETPTGLSCARCPKTWSR